MEEVFYMLGNTFTLYFFFNRIFKLKGSLLRTQSELQILQNQFKPSQKALQDSLKDAKNANQQNHNLHKKMQDVTNELTQKGLINDELNKKLAVCKG